MKFCSNCGYRMEDSSNFCPKCGAKAEKIEEAASAEENQLEGPAPYQQFASVGEEGQPEETTSPNQQSDPLGYITVPSLKKSKILIFLTMLATAISIICCSLPFLEKSSLFGKYSVDLFTLIEEARYSSHHYIATDGFVAILGVTMSFVCAFVSLSKSSYLIGSIIFTITGMIGAYKAVSEDLDYLASGFTSYEYLSALTIILSLAALIVASRERQTENN